MVSYHLMEMKMDREYVIGFKGLNVIIGLRITLNYDKRNAIPGVINGSIIINGHCNYNHHELYSNSFSYITAYYSHC